MSEDTKKSLYLPHQHSCFVLLMTSCYTTIAISRRAGYFKFRDDDEYDCEAISAKRSFQCEASIAEMEGCLFWELKKKLVLYHLHVHYNSGTLEAQNVMFMPSIEMTGCFDCGTPCCVNLEIIEQKQLLKRSIRLYCWNVFNTQFWEFSDDLPCQLSQYNMRKWLHITQVRNYPQQVFLMITTLVCIVLSQSS